MEYSGFGVGPKWSIAGLRRSKNTPSWVSITVPEFQNMNRKFKFPFCKPENLWVTLRNPEKFPGFFLVSILETRM